MSEGHDGRADLLPPHELHRGSACPRAEPPVPRRRGAPPAVDDLAGAGAPLSPRRSIRTCRSACINSASLYGGGHRSQGAHIFGGGPKSPVLRFASIERESAENKEESDVATGAAAEDRPLV